MDLLKALAFYYDENAVLEAGRALMVLSGLPRIRTTILPPRTPRARRHVLQVQTARFDERMKEILRGFGFSWNPDLFRWELLGMREKLLPVEEALDAWNGRKCGDIRVTRRSLEESYPRALPHQIENVLALTKAYRDGWHGFLVADDPGMGKSYSAMMFASLMMDAGAATRFFAVTQASIVEDWIKEWTAHFGSDVCSFLAGRSDAVIQEEMRSARLVVTTYDLLRSRFSSGRLPLSLFRGGVVVCDEITECRTRTTGVHDTLRHACCASEFAVGLSGTPVVNHIGDLWTVMYMMDPFIFPKREFYDRHVDIETTRIWNVHTKKPQEIRKEIYKNEEEFRKKVSPFFIRHEKETYFRDAGVHSERRVVMVPCDGSFESLTAAAMNDYLSARFKISVLQDLERIAPKQMSLLPEEMQDERLCLDALAADTEKHLSSRYVGLLQIALNDPHTLCLSEAEEVSHMLQFMAVRKRQGAFPAPLPEEMADRLSLKTRALADLLEGEWKNRKVVVFTGYARMADRLRDQLRTVLPERWVESVTGTSGAKMKTKTTKDFGESRNGVLLGTDTLSYGLNGLKDADVLVHYDLPWDPATMQQRNERLRRLGMSEVDKQVVFLRMNHPLEVCKWRRVCSKAAVQELVMQVM